MFRTWYVEKTKVLYPPYFVQNKYKNLIFKEGVHFIRTYYPFFKSVVGISYTESLCVSNLVKDKLHTLSLNISNDSIIESKYNDLASILSSNIKKIKFFDRQVILDTIWWYLYFYYKYIAEFLRKDINVYFGLYPIDTKIKVEKIIAFSPFHSIGFIDIYKYENYNIENFINPIEVLGILVGNGSY